jgi:hypothetical protein
MEFHHHSKLEKVQRRWKGIHRKRELTAGNVQRVYGWCAVGDQHAHSFHSSTHSAASPVPRSKARRLGPINKLHSRIYRCVRRRCIFMCVWCSGAALRDWGAARPVPALCRLHTVAAIMYMSARHVCFLIKSLLSSANLGYSLKFTALWLWIYELGLWFKAPICACYPVWGDYSH